MTAREWFRLMLRERRAFPMDSLDYEWRTAAARKYLWLMRGIPVKEWTE